MWIMGNTSSLIAKFTGVVMDISFAKEAHPLQVVPTTSAITSLVIGDATTAEAKGRRSFSEHDWAASHPAGQLKKPFLRGPKDEMSPLSSCAVPVSHHTLPAIVDAMTELPFAIVLLCDRDDVLLGLATQSDMHRPLAEDGSFQRMKAKDRLTSFAKCQNVNGDVGEA
jgi:hypothetical protein